MTETGKRHPKFWNVVGTKAIIVGFLGMAFITVYLLWGIYALVFVPDAPPALSPVLPGVKIPGVPFTFPLWYTLAALFFAIIVHEGMHGILSSAYKIPIKSSGFAFLGPIPGAFVEPDEKKMAKRPRKEQLAILAGGPFANVVLAVIALGLMFLFATAANTMTDAIGVSYESLDEGSAAAAAGMPSSGTITAIGGESVTNTKDLLADLEGLKPGDEITLTISDAEYTAVLGENPADASQAYLGVKTVTNETVRKDGVPVALYFAAIIVMTTAFWTYIISLGIGIANLLPIGPIDGGRMILLALESRFEKERAKGIWARASTVLIILVIILVAVPILKAIF
jgi:membrane-associated protease RseP (regulator of RpoE activity)